MQVYYGVLFTAVKEILARKLLFRAWLPISCFIAAIIFPACIFFHSTLWHNSPSFLQQATKLKRVANFEQLNSSSSAQQRQLQEQCRKSSTFFTRTKGKKLKRPANKAQFYCELRTRATLSPPLYLRCAIFNGPYILLGFSSIALAFNEMLSFWRCERHIREVFSRKIDKNKKVSFL